MTDMKMVDPPMPDARLRVPERVLMRRVGEEQVLLNLADETYYGLNPVGSRLIELANGGATLGEIIDRLHAEFEVEHGQLTIDVRRIAAELIAAGLIELGTEE
ncbi:MAG: PqqD family protein [Betaproteobacteria bacterium]|nr:MAG: PqqD family protein [Betaproteobacteria bacterium]